MKQYFKKGNVTTKDVTALEELRDLDLSHGTLGARGLFFPVVFAAQFSPQTKGKKPSGTQSKVMANKLTFLPYVQKI